MMPPDATGMDAGVPAGLLQGHLQIVVGGKFAIVVAYPAELERLSFDRLAYHVLDFDKDFPGKFRPEDLAVAHQRTDR